MERPSCYAEFWPIYVREHNSPITRAWHFASLSAAFVIAIALLPVGLPWWLVLAPALGTLIGYGGSFIGHALVENSRPTVFKNPWWSARSALQMYLLMWQGRMTAEAERLFAPAAAD